MARTLLTLLVALLAMASGTTFAAAQEDEFACAPDDSVAEVAQADELEPEDDLLGEEDDWADDEEDWADPDPVDEDELLRDELCEAEGGSEELPTDGSVELHEDAADTAGRVRRGGARDDRLIGDGRANQLFGEGGDDYLDGRGGRDVLNGGPDDDTLITGKSSTRAKGVRVRKKGDEVSGGRGNDVVRARNGRVDRIHCGKGRDTVLAERGDRIRRDNCETVVYR